MSGFVSIPTAVAMPLIVDKSYLCRCRQLTNPSLVRYANYDMRVTIGESDHLYNKAGGMAHRIMFGESSYQMRTSIIDDALKKRLWLLSLARHRVSPLIEG